MEPKRLELDGIKDDYQSSKLSDFKDEDFYLRVTAPETNPDDSFFVKVPKDYSQKSIKDVINYAFPQEAQKREEIANNLEVEYFEALPEIYEHILGIVDEENRGNTVLDWSANLGKRNLNLDEIVEDQCSVCHVEEDDENFKVLHLVMDAYDVPFTEYEDSADVASDKQEFRGMFLFYMIANHGLDSIAKSKNHGAVKDALDYCERQNLVLPKEEGDSIKLEMTNQGKKQVSELEAENQHYNDTYEIFSSVRVDDEHIEFGAEEGKGLDLRIAAMRHDEINPYRAVMVVNMFTKAFDDVADRWEEEIRSENFFARYVGIASMSEIDLTDEQFEDVMIQGKGLEEEEDYED